MSWYKFVLPHLTFFILQVSISFIDVACLSGPDLKISNVTETRVHVEWSSVVYPNTFIEKYQVSAYPIRSYAKMEILNRNEWTFYNSTFRSDLVQLHPGTLYNISVWAVTNNGYTDPTTKNVWTEVGGEKKCKNYQLAPKPDEPPPVEIIERSGEIMMIDLPVGQSDKGPITSYYVVAIEKSPIIFFNPEEAGNYSFSQETGLPFYITANLSPEEANQTFVIGDRKTYDGYYNAPLSEKHDYEVLVGVVSSLNGVTKVAYSPLQSTIESQKRSGDISRAQTSSPLSVILSAAIGVFGFLLVLSVIIYFLLRKRYGKRRPSDEMVLRVHGSEGLTSDQSECFQQEKDENGFVPGLLQISEDADLSEVYEKLREKYWQIPRNHLDVHQTVLGIGQFGEVREGVVHRRSQTIPCIVQHMQAPSSLLEKEKRALLCELDLMSRIGFHTNVVEFLGACDAR
ncbi:putative tyrosine-protein kinase Wsck, partial [Stegodyphus dumicola]|uniref:putative tyrosine-protein kinase Wsck n=1 Tax=Stegodyphus dumicola TaxID=202533 RepID=UPI0015B2C528